MRMNINSILENRKDTGDIISNGKKELNLGRPEITQSQIGRCFSIIKKNVFDQDALVIISNIYNKIYTLGFRRNTRWKDISWLEKIACYVAYGLEHHYLAITCDFGFEFMDRVRESNSKTDYVRRVLNSALVRAFGFRPQYMFVLENVEADTRCHMHGIIQPNLDENLLRATLKRVLLGRNYKQNPINNRAICLKPIWDMGWASYIIKRINSVSVDKVKFYRPNDLKRLVEEKFQSYYKPIYDSTKTASSQSHLHPTSAITGNFQGTCYSTDSDTKSSAHNVSKNTNIVK